MYPVLVFPDGRRVELDSDVVVVGRAPVAPEEFPAARSVSVSAPTVSKTHALIGSDADGVWLLDLHSSNGSEALDSLGVSEPAIPGQRLSIPVGSHIRIGTDTIITIDAGVPAGDDDRTVTIHPAPSPAPTPPPTPTPPPAAAPVDWSALDQPAPAEPSAAPVLPQQPAAQPPPPVAPAPQPLPPVESQPASPVTEAFTPISPAAAPPAATPPAPAPGFQSAPGPAYGSVPSSPPQVSSSGRSKAHLIGALVLAVWSAVGFADLRRWIPDAVVDAVDGRIIDFFVVPDRDFLEFAEFYSFLSLPDPLSFLARGADIGPIVAIVFGVIALLAPRAAVRWLLIGLVAIPLVVLFGFLVTIGVDSFEDLTEDIDRFIPWFVLPVIGSVLLMLPRRRSDSAPVPSQDVFYAPNQAAGPPAAGPAAPPIS